MRRRDERARARDGIGRWTTPRSGARRIFAALGLLALFAIAGTPAAAEDDPQDGPAPARVEGAHPRSAATVAIGHAVPGDGAPATRASERERIDGIDPAHWLVRFGEVERQAPAPAE